MWAMKHKSKVLLVCLLSPLLLTGFSPSKSKCNPPKVLNCVNANLKNAKLAKVNLSGANLKGANLTRANMKGAN